MTRFRTIVVGIDFSPLAEVALKAAAHLADELGSERLHLVHVMQGSPGWAVPLHEGIALAWKSALELAEKELNELDVPPTRARVTRQTVLGGPAFELVQAAETAKADLLVVATHKRGQLGRLVMGSVASAVIRGAHCPVMIVGEDRRGLSAVRKVLAPIDLSPISEQVLTAAAAIAKPHRGIVEAFSLYEIPSLIRDQDVLARFLSPEEATSFSDKYRAQVSALVDRVREPDVEMVVHVASKTPPSRAILELAREARPDLIVLGTSGHNTWQRMFLGSTATSVIAEAPCPVLVVPHEAR
ncbi:universal stress protein [Myxococcota bacterium]|nr:universal stress protein [Myxococcota bacterium]